MFRFYDKDNKKLKRMETPGYIGQEPMNMYF